MRYFTVAAVVALAFATSAAGQESPKVSLGWKFSKGETLRYEVNSLYEVTGASAQSRDGVLLLALQVTEVGKDGNASLKVTIEKCTSGGVSYTKLAGKSFTMSMSRLGQVSEVKGLKELMKSVDEDGDDEDGDDDDGDEDDGDEDGDDDESAWMQQCFPLMPSAALVKGNTVEQDATCKEGQGAVRMKSTLKELRDGGKLALVDQGWTFEPKKGAANGVASATSSSEISWLVERGALQSHKTVLSYAGSANGSEYTVKTTVSVKLAAEKAKAEGARQK